MEADRGGTSVDDRHRPAHRLTNLQRPKLDDLVIRVDDLHLTQINKLDDFVNRVDDLHLIRINNT